MSNSNSNSNKVINAEWYGERKDPPTVPIVVESVADFIHALFIHWGINRSDSRIYILSDSKDTVDGHLIAGGCRIIATTTEDGEEIILLIPDLDMDAALVNVTDGQLTGKPLVVSIGDIALPTANG